MKKLIIISLVAIMAACSANVEDRQKEKEAELAHYKEDLRELKKKISELEKELNNNKKDGIIAIEATPAKYELYEHFVDVTGKVEADKNIIISPEASGKIISINVKEGDKIKKGTVLAKLNTKMIERSLDEIEINLKLAKTTYERQANLWNQNIGSEMEYLQTKSQKESLEHKKEALKAQLDMAVIRAPINGIVDEIIQKQGEMASPQMPFARLVNIDDVYVSADVSEIYLQKVKAGDNVKVEFPVIDKSINAKIYRASSVIDPASRTFRLRVNLDNSTNDIKPNMLAILKLRTFADKEAIVVPSILVKKDFSGEFIFIAQEEEGKIKAKKRYIQTGIKDNNNTLVTEGINIDDKIITKGFAQVVDGSVVSL